MSNPPPSAERNELVAPALAFWLVLLGVPTWLLNRAIIPALPGSGSDIEQLLNRAIAVGSISSQLLALGIALLLIRLVASNLGTASLPGIERLLVLPVASGVGFLVVAASAGSLDPELHLLLAAMASLGLLVCSRTALRQPSTRAGGILLALIVAASICLAASRLVALRASLQAIPRQYALARALATIGEVFDVLSLLWVMLWFVLSSRGHGPQRVALAIVAALSVTTLARLGHQSDPRFIQVVVARALGALRREPNPFGPEFLGPATDVLAVFLALVLVSPVNGKSAVARRAMALLLLGRCALDVPALSGLATAGGLLLAWFSPSNLSPQQPQLDIASATSPKATEPSGADD